MHPTAHSSSRPTPAGAIFYASLAAVLALVGAAIYAIFVQMRDGLGVTGLNNFVTWSFYIVSFEFFVGISTGAIVLAGIVFGFRVRRLRSVGRLAAFVAFVSLALAGISILLSMGRPDRAWTILVSGRLSSPLVWDVIAISSSLVLFGAILHLCTRTAFARAAEQRPKLAWLLRTLALGRADTSEGRAERDERRLRTLSLLALPWAVVLHSVTAWIFGLLKARPAWHSTLLAPLYVVSAVVSGVALVLLVVLLAKWFMKAKPADKTIEAMARILLVAVPVLGYFLFAEMLTTTYTDGTTSDPFFAEMLQGPYAWVFWFNLFGGLLVPLVILVWPALRRNDVMLGLAALLTVLGVYAERFNLVVIPQLHKVLLDQHGTYSPTWVEIWITVGVAAILIAALMVFSRLIPLVEEPEESAPPA